MVKCLVLLLAEHMLVQIVEVAAVFASDQPDTGVLNKSRNWGSVIGEGTEKRKNKVSNRVDIPPLLVLECTGYNVIF